MRFLKLKFRPADIFLIPLMCVIMFAWQYYSITNDIKNQEKKFEERLEKLAKECRQGKQQSCDEYTSLLQRTTYTNNP